jgi:hypothetical protein
MDSKRRRELMLAGAAVLLAAVAVWSMRRETAPSTAASAPAATQSAASARAGEKEPAAEIDLSALESERPEPDASTRDPFRFKPRPAPSLPPEVLKQQQQQANAAAELAARGPAEPPPPPRIPLKYIGEMADPVNAGKRVAILSDARGVYYGREGEVVEGRYRIVRIGVESIELSYLDGRGRQTIRQTGQ